MTKLGYQIPNFTYPGVAADQIFDNLVTQAKTAEAAGFDTVFTAEAWGSDAFTPLAWWGRETTRMRLGTSVVQLSARTPTACAMASLTLDHLSGGRIVHIHVFAATGRDHCPIDEMIVSWNCHCATSMYVCPFARWVAGLACVSLRTARSPCCD